MNNNNHNHNHNHNHFFYMCMVKIQKFCNNNNDDNLNKGNTVLCTLHLMSDAFGTYKIKKKILDILCNYYYNTGLQKKTVANSICSLNVAIPM